MVEPFKRPLNNMHGERGAPGSYSEELSVNHTDQTWSYQSQPDPLPSPADHTKNPSPAPQQKLAEARERWDTASRINEQFTIFSIALMTPVTLLTDEDATEAVFTANFIGCILGIIAGGGWILFEKKLPLSLRKKLNANHANPWSRRAKTCFVLGSKVGEMIGYFIPLPKLPGFHLTQKIITKILAAFIGILFGIGGVIFFNADLNEKTEKLLKIGRDSWTKYCKAGIVAGSCIGSLTGGILGTVFFLGLGTASGIAIGGAIGSVLGFISTALAVPCMNYIKLHFKKAQSSEIQTQTSTFSAFFNNYRTNYFRAGLTLGSNIGAVIGAILGVVTFPSIGLALGGLLGGAAGGIIGGVALSLLGPLISRYAVEHKKRTANTFDYGLRTGAMFGGYTGLGQALSPTVGAYGTTFPAIGGAFFGLVGAGREIYHARQLEKEGGKDEAYLLPWSQSAASGIMIGSTIGGFIGILLFPPLGGAIGGGLGGLLGGVFALTAFPYLLKKCGTIPAEEKKEKSLTSPLVHASKLSTKTMIEAQTQVKITTDTTSLTVKKENEIPTWHDKEKIDIPLSDPLPRKAKSISTRKLFSSPQLTRKKAYASMPTLLFKHPKKINALPASLCNAPKTQTTMTAS